MKAFEIYSWQPEGWPEPHPAVVISHPDRVDRKPDVEVVLCSTQEAKRDPQPHEVVLDRADGLDGPTLCKCDLIYNVPRALLEKSRRRGEIVSHRRGAIVRTIIGAHGWTKLL